MKIIRMLICLAVFHGFCSNVFAIAIVYDGIDCFNVTNDSDVTASGLPVQSKFEVIEDLGQGMYRLNLTGGIPRFVDSSGNVCIDHVAALGYFASGGPDFTIPPQPLESLDATGYFNGHELVILVNSIVTDFSAGKGSFNSFHTSRVQTISNMLIFDYNYNPQQSFFTLKRLVRNKSLTQASSSSNTQPIRETLLPSSINGIESDRPQVLTPLPSSINYLLQ
ncbi:hypothetical protein W03_19410 [Nitrosomonas sp. PY1]|uniref:hypothetical protein n=1 Tax=Nitrosomonas sp. PY1 TaxID=1803906 RepID=UPI001FC8388A|nr:hypothetical protein [Nitrosomonas sp. PY1]GKS69937.1 hypothetical protein W03_19410 [Nitrosomonas sp. PY1]